jgi:exonuclease SbcC
MIKKISIKNYQSHRDSVLELHENVNVIIGNSDSGKSAIIRAIKWVRDNRPSGEDFRSTWGGKTDVEVITDDATIVRSKDKDNEYILNGTSFKAFGTDVPKEISDALNLDGSNIAFQLDSPFLLSETPGNTASFFNKVANIDKIDTGTQKVNSAIRELTADIKYKEAQDVKLTEDLKTYEHIDIFQYDVEQLEEMDRQSQKLDASFRKLYQWQATYYENKSKIEHFQKTLELEKPLNIVLNLIEERAKKDIEEVKLDRLVNHIQRIQVEIDEQKELLKSEKLVTELLQLYSDKKMAEDRRGKLSVVVSSLKGIQDSLNTQMPLIGLKTLVDDLLELISQRDKAEESKLVLFRTVSSLRTIQTRITNGNVWIKNKESEYNEAIIISGICIYCGSTVKNHKHK